MAIVPFSSAPRIARDAQAAADLREQQAAEEGRRYREAADAKLKELRAKGVKKFDPQGGTSMINLPDPVPPGGARLNAPGIETPDMREPGGYFSDSYQPQPGDALWNQYESDRTGPNKDIGYVALPGQSGSGVGGPDDPVNDPALASIAEQMIARQKERASYSLTAGLMQSTATPDQAAADVETAGKAGVSRVQVEADRKTFALKVQQDEFDKLSNESPLTYSWLTQDYDNLEVAKDDHQNLSWWETAGRMIYNTPGALWSSAVKFGERTLGVTQMGVDAGDELGRSPSPAMAAIFGNPNEANRIARDLNARASGGTLPQDPNSPLAMASRAINAPRMSLREYADAVMPQGRNDIERGYYSGIVSLGQNAPLIIASAITKNPSIMTLGMTGTTAGEAYSRATDEHPELTYGERAAYALTQAGIEFLTEVGPNALFVEALLKGSIKEQVKGFAKQQLVEQFGEQTATAFQDMNDWLTLNPKATWEDYLKERPSAALQTFVATLVAGGGQIAIGKASDAVGQKLDAANQQKRAEDLAAFMTAMGDNAANSKLLKRGNAGADKYREVVAHVTEGKEVRISPEGITELAQSQNVKPEQLAQAFRIDPETMVQAMDAGDDIVVPVGNFAAVIQTAKKDIGVSGETIFQTLAPHTRLTENDFTAKESEAFQKIAKAEADARAEWNTTENDFSDSAEKVSVDILDQVRAMGRWNEDTNQTQAKLVAQINNVWAKQTNQDPAKHWEQQGATIMSALAGEQQPDGATTSQSSPRQANPPSDFDLKWAAEDLEPKQFEAWKAAREGLSNEQIAVRMNEVEPDAVHTPADVSKWLQLARRQGYDSEKAAKHVKAPETERIIQLRAKGWKNGDIARSVYPDVATDAALNRVKALASKNKAKIEERKTELAGSPSLAQTSSERISAIIRDRLGVGEGRPSVTLDDETILRASEALTESEFTAWKAANQGASLDAIADLLSSESRTVTPATASVTLAHAKAKGYDFPLAKRGKPVSQELVKALELRATGLSPRKIAERVFPDRDTDKALALVRYWLSQHKEILTEIAAQEGSLAQDANATITFNRNARTLIRMFEGANLSSLAHEGAHWYLDLLFRMSRSENPHPFVAAQMARVLEFAGKSQEWDGMFDATGNFTEEGKKLQEQFAEAFEVYLMTGKAPSVGMRSVFNTFKQWILGVYKAMRKGVGQAVRDVGPYTRDRIAAKERELGRKLNDDELFAFVVPQELRDVFDRMLATEDAINAAQTTMLRDSEAMSKAMLEKLDPEEKWKPERREKFVQRMRDRYAEAKERAEAALLARLMDEHTRARSTVAKEEERDIRREVASEIDEQPAQRVYQVLSGQGWRDTRADHAEAQADAAEAMLTLAQADGYLGTDVAEAVEWIAAREKGLDLSPEARKARAKQQGFTKRLFHETKTASDVLQSGFDLNRRQAATGDSVMPIGVFTKPGEGSIGIGGQQMELLVRLGNTRTFADRAELEAHLRQDEEYAKLADEAAAIDAQNKQKFDALDAAWRNTERRSPEWRQRSDELNVVLRAWDEATAIAGEAARVRATAVLKAEGLNSITVTKDAGSFTRAVKTTVVLDPKDLRSVNAAFDPDSTNSTNLLAHGGDGSTTTAPRYTDFSATDESLAALREQMIADGRIPLILLFKATSGRIIAFPGGMGEDGLHHDMARTILDLGDLKLQHGIYNPRKWASVSDMTGSDAWYDTTGTQADDAGSSLAQSKSPLPMDEGARRKAWQAEKGPVNDTVLYHGTASDIQQFDPSKRGSVTNARSAKLGTWLTESPKTAGGYADLASEKAVEDLVKKSQAAERAGQWDKANDYMVQAEKLEASGGAGGQNTMPLYVRGKMKTVDMEGAKYDPADHDLSGMVREAKAEGFDGVRFENFSDEAGWGNYEPTTHVVIFDPANIRSVNAKFDPSQSQSSKLLAQTRTGKDRIAQPASIPAMRLNLDAVREQYGEEAVAALPPAVRAYSTEATDADDFVLQAKAVRQTLNKKHPKSLWKFLATQRRIGEGNDKISYRGIRDDGGEILKIIGEKKAGPGLIADGEDGKRSRSYTIEHAAEVAWAEGYFNTESPPTPQEFLDALRADFDGQAKLYTRADMPLVDEIRNAEQWAAWFDENGIDIAEKDQAVLKAQIETKLSGQSENAIGPDEAAPFFGMSDGKALLEGLKQGPLRDKLIREETKRRMTERHGDTFSDGTLMAEAQAYARNEIQHRQFEIELEALADAAGQRAQANLAKQTAIDNLRSKQVREVLNYNQWLTLSERWGKKAVEAAAKGDMAKAMEFARYRLINSHMYTEGKKLAEKIEKTRTHLLDYGKKTKQARLFAAGKEYQATMNGLLDDYQFRNETKKGESQRAARGLWIKAQLAGIDPWAAYKDPTKTPAEQQVAAAEQIEKSTLLAELGEGVDARNYKSITVEELLAVRDEADLIWRLATLKDRLLKEGERRRIGLAAEDMAASVIANQPKAREPEGIESNLRGEKLKRGVEGVLSAHRTLQSLIREMDGGKNGGVLWRYLIKPLNAAFAHKSTLMKQAGTEVAKLFEVFSNKEISRFAKDRQTLTLRARDGSTTKVTLTTQGRLAIALNAGNEKNRARLMDSNGWDEAQLQQVLDTLDKRSWDWVQSIWDYLNTWFPEANRVHEAVHGAPMDKVASLPVATRFGIYAGGYFPIRYDANRSSKSGQRALEKDAQAGGAGRVGVRTKEGFTKSRVEGKVTLPLLLDPFMVIMSHLDEVTTSIATEETLFDVGRLAMRSEFQDAVVERHGRARYNEIIEVLKAAKFGLQGPRGVIEGIMNHVRNGSTVAKLGWNLKTALLQPAGFSNSAVRIGSTWLLRGYGKMIGSGVKMQGWGKWAIDKSEFMRHRRDHQSPEQVNLLATLKGNKPLVVAQRSVYQLMAQTQFFGVDVPTFIGMYDRAIAEGATDEDAVAQAEQAVIDAQGGGEVFQTAGIQRGSVPMRLWTNLMSYMITTYNLSVQRLAQKDPNALAKITRLTGDMLLLWSVPVAATMFITYVIQQALSGGGDDDDEYWSAENMAREQLSFLMGPFFGLSQVAGAVKTDPFEYRGPAGADIITQGYKAMDAASHGEVLELLRPANQVAGMIFHLPANQIDKSVRGTLALWNGETNNPAAIFFGPPPKN